MTLFDTDIHTCIQFIHRFCSLIECKGTGSIAKRWCFTINNYTQEDIDLLGTSSSTHECFIKYGKEVAPSTGTNHLQGYIILPKKQRLTAVKKLVGNKAHIELMRGTVKQNDTYVSKEGSVTELGDVDLKKNQKDHMVPIFKRLWMLNKHGRVTAMKL